MIAITDAHNEYRLAGTLNFLNLGVDTARVRIFGNTRPGSVGDAPGAAPLVEIPLADPPGSVAAGVLTLTPSDDGLITASGTAAWARVVNGNGDTAFDCDVSDTAGSGTIKLPDTALFAGGVTRLISGTLG